MIELLVVVVVVALLAMVAVPSYNKSVSKARRADAQSSLIAFAQAMERFHTDDGTYVGAAGTESSPETTGSPWIHPAATPVESSVKFYNLTIEVANSSAFTLRATPIGPQTSDGYMEIQSTGVQRWDRNNDGDTDDTDENHW